MTIPSATTDMDVDVAASEHIDEAEFNKAVWDAIKQHQATNSSHEFALPGTFLRSADRSELLHILMKVRVGSGSMDVADCLNYLRLHTNLDDSLTDIHQSGSFVTLLTNADMPPDFLKDSSQPLEGIPSSVSNQSLKLAFEESYMGSVYQVFIDWLDRERHYYTGLGRSQRPYNWGVSVIQSSGTGKSRMMEEAANEVFTIPMNLREQLSDIRSRSQTFPPPDPTIRNYFTGHTERKNEEQIADYSVFLTVLFDKTRETVEMNWPTLIGRELAQAWAKYLRDGQTNNDNGMNRQRLYEEVVKETLNRCRNPKIDKEATGSLTQSCQKLIKTLLPVNPDDKNVLFVYFDEAHPLTKTDGSNRSPYRNLGTVLSELQSCQAIFIFLSTNSRLEDYAPSARHHPSLRVFQGSKLISPFNELPFDLHEKQVRQEFAPSLKLEDVYKTEVIVGYGRPLWYAQYQIDPKDIFGFAADKLVASEVEEREQDARIAAVAVRVGLTFGAIHPAAVDLQSRLTESHMRVVYSIPSHRNYMHTGSPSEPVLAEAAGRHLSGKSLKGLSVEGPKVLAAKCEDWSLSRGERGELAGRLLVSSAYDIALKRYFAKRPNGTPLNHLPRFHHPVPLLYWIRGLFGQSHHETVLDAEPVASEDGGTKLKDAFKDSYVFFSHFSPAEDEEMLSTSSLATALVRGMAMQAKENQVSIDAVIPVHLGSPSTPISVRTTSAVNLQFKNRKNPTKCCVDRTITVSDTTKPTISIVFELGAKNKNKPGVVIAREPRRATRSGQKPAHPDDHHYFITVYGCDSTSFDAIPPEVEPDYRTFLAGGIGMADFPRKDHETHMEMLHSMNPSFRGSRQQARFPELIMDEN